MPSVINSDNGAVSGSAGLKIDSADDGILHIQNSGNTSVVVSESGMRVPIGTTAERPASPQNGMIRYNTDTLELEAYANGSWKSVAGVEPALKLDFDEYQFDGRISFTRATNGTYFDRNGVLRTAGSGVPRFDHRLENGSWVNKGLLIEEARTNLALRSEELNDSYWFKEQTTVTANQTTSPDGTTTADAVFENSTTNFHYIRIGNTSINATSTPYTVSIFVKANGRTRGQFKLGYVTGSFQEISVSFNLSTGTIGSPFASSGGLVQGFSITNNGNGWYRITLSGYTGQNGIHALQLFFLDDSGVGSYAGDITKGMYMWGAQLEVGAFPTSYIATTSASVTRNDDVASMTGTNFSSWYNATEGTVLWQGDYVGISGGNLFSGWEISDNTAAERLILINQNATGLTNTLIVRDNATDVATILSPDPRITAVINQTYKTASAYKLNDIAHTLDGRTPGTDTSATLPTVNTLRIGCGNEAGTSASFINGHIAKFYYWPNRLPNSKLQSLTS